jgi:hypothetical protein
MNYPIPLGVGFSSVDHIKKPCPFLKGRVKISLQQTHVAIQSLSGASKKLQKKTNF